MEQETKPASVLNIPTAIIVAGALIALAIIYTQTGGGTKTQVVRQSPEEQIQPITTDDHILGNPNAKVKIVEYSDTSCPFCKAFHNTMNKVMDTYGSAGNVAWVYRHYPLDKPDGSGNILHPNAGHEAQSMECAASLGGNDTFWKYTNRLYEITPSVTSQAPNGLARTELPKIAQYAGLNADDFNNCLASGKFKAAVDADFLDGVNIGISGTPTSIIILDKALPAGLKPQLMNIYAQYQDSNGEYPIRLSTDSKMVVIGGAMPYETMKATIDLFFTY